MTTHTILFVLLASVASLADLHSDEPTRSFKPLTKAAETQIWSVTLTVKKECTVTDAPLTIAVKNLGDKLLTFKVKGAPVLPAFGIVVKDERGVQCPYTQLGKVAFVMGNDSATAFFKLAPGDSHQWTFPLEKFFNLPTGVCSITVEGVAMIGLAGQGDREVAKFRISDFRVPISAEK